VRPACRHPAPLPRRAPPPTRSPAAPARPARSSLQSDAYLGSTQQVAIHPGAGTPGAKLSGSQRPKAPRDAAAAPRGGGGGSKKPRKGRRKDSKEPPLPKEGADTKLEEVRSPRPAASAQDQAAVVDDDYVDTSAAAAAAAAASPSPAGRPPIEGFAPVDDDEGRGGAAAAGAASNDAQEDERDEEYEEEDDDAAGDADAAAAAAAAAVAAAVAAADAGGAPQPAAGPRPALGGLAAGAAAAGEWAHRPRRELNLSRTFGGMQDDDQAAVLAELGACATLPCLISVHDKLAGRTRFNLPHFFLVGAPRFFRPVFSRPFSGPPKRGCCARCFLAGTQCMRGFLARLHAPEEQPSRAEEDPAPPACVRPAPAAPRRPPHRALPPSPPSSQAGSSAAPRRWAPTCGAIPR
jgi:hypothetical protein